MDIKSSNKLEPGTEDVLMLYFTSPDCQVCKVLKPRIRQLIDEKFPEITLHFVDIAESPSVAGQHQVFTVPVILVFFEGKEILRKVRNISINELRKELERPYRLFFD